MEIECDQQQSTKSLEINNEGLKSVDLSNNGLTMVPVTIFKRYDIVKLDLSDNNIKSLPVSIVDLKNLQYLNICRNGFHCTSSDDTTVLPRGMRNILSLQYLNISECNLSFVPATIWEITSLIQLDISRNNIGVLKPDIGNLDQLKWLNVQHTGLTTLPMEIVGCEKLETLLLYGNVIQTLPYLLAEMVNLQNLHVNLRHIAKNIDSNMESLLHSGQILSDHISNTIFNLPAVKKIELEYCKVNYFKQFQSKNLEELYLRGNFFREIPNTVLDHMKLKILDLSNNLLTNITDDVILMASVEILLLQGNQLETLSSNVFKMKSLQLLDVSNNKLKIITIPEDHCNNSLITFNISHNQITQLPNSIINLKTLQDLNVTNNKISELPLDLCLMKEISYAHKIKGLYKIGLWLLKNPIVFPPKSVWNTTNIELIYSFLRRIKIERTQKQTPVRIILLGEDNLAKQAFLDRFMNKTPSNNFQYITINHWMSSNRVPFVFININCHSIYSLHWRHFIDDNTLIWLFLDNDPYNDDRLKQIIENWMGIIIDYSNSSVIQLIKLLNSDNPSLESDSRNKEKSESEINENNNNEINDNKNKLINYLLEKYRDENLKILPNILEISHNDSLKVIQDRLEYIAIDDELFFEDNTFKILINETIEIENLCKSSPCVFIRKLELIEKIKTSINITDENIDLCLKKLHKQGKILWFYNNRKLSEKIYPFINIFNRSIHCLLKLNYDQELNYLTNPLLKAEGLMNEEQFKIVYDNFISYGQISYPLYKILTFQMIKSLDIKDFLLDANLAWMAPLSEFLEESIFQRPYIVLPQFNNDKFDGTYFMENIIKNNNNTNIDCAISINCSSIIDCSDLFLNLRCAINDWAIRRYDWKNIIYLYNNDCDIILMKEMEDHSETIINIIVRMWSRSTIEQLPYGANFKEWITDYYEAEKSNRRKFVYKIVDLNILNLTEYVCRFSDNNLL